MAVTITQEITLDVVKYNTFSLKAKRYDTSSRFLKVTVQQDGVTLDVSDAVSATINIRRPDDETATYLGTVNSDGTVTVPLPNYALQLDGDVKCSVGVLGNGTELKTLNFTVEVQDAESDGDDISEDENYNALLQLIDQVENLSSVYLANYSASSAPTKNSLYNSADLSYQNMNEAVGTEFVCVWEDNNNDIDYFCTCYISKVNDDTFTFVVTNYVRLTGEQGEQGEQGEAGQDGTNGSDGKDGSDGANGADGVGIASIAKTKTVDLVDTYTITLTDGTTYDFTVTNGADGTGTTATATVETDSDGDTVLVLSGVTASTTTDSDGNTVLVLS